MSDGTRKLMNVTEITGMEGDTITMQDIFTFQKKGLGPNGEVLGDFVAQRNSPQVFRAAVGGGNSPTHGHV